MHVLGNGLENAYLLLEMVVYISPLCMWNEDFYLFGLKEEATAALWRGSLSAGSDKVSPKPDKKATDRHNSSSKIT